VLGLLDAAIGRARAPLETQTAGFERRSRSCRFGRAAASARPAERQLRQAQDEDQGKRGQWCRDDEHGLDAADDLCPRRAPDRVQAGSRGACASGVRREHGTEDGRSRGAPEPAEERGCGGGGPEQALLDAVLDGDDKDLRDHPEAEAEDSDPDAGARLRGMAGEGRQQRKRRAHQCETGDREALVPAGAGDASPRHRRRDRDAEHHRDKEQARLRRGGAGCGLQEQWHEHGDREQRRCCEEERRARHRDCGRPEHAQGHDRIRRAPLADDCSQAEERRGRDQAEDLPRTPGVAVAAPDTGQHQRARGPGDQACAQGVERLRRPLGLGCRQSSVQPGESRRSDREVDVEHRAPTDILHEQPADQWADNRGRGEGGSDVTLIAPALARVDEIADRGHRQRHQPAGSCALDCAQRDQHADALGRAAQHRCADEQHERNLKQPFAPVPVAELAPQRRRRRGGHHIGGHEPGDVAEAAEVGGDRRQPGRENGLVEHGRQHCEHNRCERPRDRLPRWLRIIHLEPLEQITLSINIQRV